MSNLPSLRHLLLRFRRWDEVPCGDQPPFPTLELESFHLAWLNLDDLPDETILLAIHTRKLTMNLCGEVTPAVALRIARYLRHLGGHLEYLPPAPALVRASRNCEMIHF